MFEINAVSEDGEVFRRNRWPAVAARISGAPRRLTIAFKGTIEGDIDLASMPIGGLPRDQDLLLVWSYSIGKFPFNSGSVVLQGVTYLKAT